MQAGRDLDYLIAEQVMGINIFILHTMNDIPRYSTDIAAAWEIVEKLRLAILPMSNGQWAAALNDDKEFVPGFIADTAQYAICLAALKAVNP